MDWPGNSYEASAFGRFSCFGIKEMLTLFSKSSPGPSTQQQKKSNDAYLKRERKRVIYKAKSKHGEKVGHLS